MEDGSYQVSNAEPGAMTEHGVGAAESTRRHRHRRASRREPRGKQFLRWYGWELVWGAALLMGIFVLFGPRAHG